MGDMKTPDFDDLLAAFDIPDIEAIQSNPEENQHEAVTNAAVEENGSLSCFARSPAPNAERPAVSVIVKNAVLPQLYIEEEEEEEEEEEKSGGDKTIRDLTTGTELNFPFQNNLSDLHLQVDSKPAAVEPQISNGFKTSMLMNHTQWSPVRSTLNDNESDPNNDAKPILCSQSLSNTGPDHSVLTPLHSLSPLQKDDCLLSDVSPSTVPHSIGTETETKTAVHSEDADSEPDLGSPLMIHESPESLLSSPSHLKPQPDVLATLENSSSNISPRLSSSSISPTRLEPLLGNEKHTSTPTFPTAAPQLQSPKDRLLSRFTGCAPIQEEKYPEHVIDERDSPESPPPSETGVVVPIRNGSPELDKAPGSPGQTEELQERSAEEEEKLKEENSVAEKNKEDSGDLMDTESIMSDISAETDSSPPRPLKVKIKVPTGSITKTIASLTPMKNARIASKAVGGSKASVEHQSTNSKRGSSQRLQSPAAAVIQDICPAKPESASEAKQKCVTDKKTTVTSTDAGSKTTSMPSVSYPRISSGVVTLRSLGQKAIKRGTLLPSPSPLHPPQSSGKPASIVNNTGAIISKSQTSLVEAFNKILNNKNLLPVYKPDLSAALPAEWGVPLPAQGYRCLECGDAFALEQSLARHYDRRSLRIEVTCNHCAKRLAFFNKCSLLLHAREHKEKGLIMQCSHLIMKTVPVDQMISRLDPTAVGSVTSAPTQQSHKAATKRPDEVQYVGNKCPECLTQFSSKEEVAEHFKEIKPGQTTVPCTECSPPMLLLNSCSAAAHRRIHQNSQPHVCPECGGTTKQSLFQTHLEKSCLHFSRRIGYRCSSCLVVFGGLNSVKSHIQQAHCDTFYKCPTCPMAFKSAQSIQDHVTAQHPTVTEGQTILIYKCVMCDTVFTQKTLLHIHFETHLINQKVHVFKCPECTKLFSQRNSLLEHVKTHRTVTVEEELPSSPAASSNPRPSVKVESSNDDEQMSGGKPKKVKSGSTKAPSGWKCAPCHARYTEREEYLTHMAEQHGKILKKFPCSKCESSFTTTSSLQRHIRDKHKVPNRGFRCQFCTGGKKMFSTKDLLERHVKLRHSVESVIQDQLMDSEDEVDSSPEQGKPLRTHRTRRQFVKMEPKEELPEGMSPIKKPRPSSSASIPESGFRCAHCGYVTEEQASFLEHISQHRRGGTAGGDLQCLQCGACFTSTSSLSRHRFIMHKMRDTAPDNQSLSLPSAAASNHSDKQDSTAPSSPSSQPSAANDTEEEDSLGCKVCGKHFERASDLNTHFRTHGMAFISARNVGKTI
ncbi:zinc finger protein 687a isoform X2 [Cynoglossus semilaevis]|uniref:zinc finger protein 687a isoform X2 n=1 Tax=Cynoglossus semilaevis TaxID=244447 RepID=UPI000495D7F9|nr:zinc finger protein 687a isoform X2 [Cynoglossus semilaevis]